MDHSGMSMASSAMIMAPTATTAAAATSTAKMSMGGMGGGSSCKISMLWNWYTVDSCFIARSWHVRSAGAFAGSCIGVILLVISLEFLRRAQRELDHYFRRANNAAAAHPSAATTTTPTIEAGSSNSSTGASSAKAINAGANESAGRSRGSAVAPLKLWQQLLRSALFMVQFAVGYFVMLLAMYYNGYIIICIFIGAFLGAALFQWDTYYSGAEGPEMRDSCCN